MDQENILRYQLIRSRRKTISIQIKGGKVIVRAPLQTKNAEIEAFIHQKMNWIEKHLKEQQKRAEEKKALPPFTEEEIRAMAERHCRSFRCGWPGMPDRSALITGGSPSGTRRPAGEAVPQRAI